MLFLHNIIVLGDEKETPIVVSCALRLCLDVYYWDRLANGVLSRIEKPQTDISLQTPTLLEVQVMPDEENVFGSGKNFRTTAMR